MLQDLKLSFGRACDLQTNIMFGIGPVQTNESCKLIRVTGCKFYVPQNARRLINVYAINFIP